uniref:TLC domain-containing protein n=1 Tax=Rhabditophanes sp. KR3021 TaxID=114890 RepID=A0AC35UHI4_9BILA
MVVDIEEATLDKRNQETRFSFPPPKGNEKNKADFVQQNLHAVGDSTSNARVVPELTPIPSRAAALDARINMSDILDPATFSDNAARYMYFGKLHIYVLATRVVCLAFGLSFGAMLVNLYYQKIRFISDNTFDYIDSFTYTSRLTNFIFDIIELITLAFSYYALKNWKPQYMCPNIFYTLYYFIARMLFAFYMLINTTTGHNWWAAYMPSILFFDYRRGAFQLFSGFMVHLVIFVIVVKAYSYMVDRMVYLDGRLQDISMKDLETRNTE